MKKEKGAELKDLILRHSLANAVQFNGRANSGAVLGKVLAEQPELKRTIDKLKKEIESAVKQINSWNIEKQKKELAKYGEIKKPEKEERKGLPPLPNAVAGRVVTRFAPEPNGFLHLGHLKSAFLSFLYAKMYKGKFFLRFDDTNPKKEKKEFYDAIREDLKKFGIKYDKEVRESANMEKFYSHAEELVKKGVLFVCMCAQQEIEKSREENKQCDCRNNSIEKNLELWKNMLESGKEGLVVVRLKYWSEENPALRDPSMLRISETPHALLGTKYKVYPMYNFACVIMDHVLGITHVLRDKGFENDARIQEVLFNLFGWRIPITIQFGRIKTAAGIPMSKRKIRDMIERGELQSYDDLRIPTPRNLLKRGFQPEAIKRLIEQIGPSKSDIDIDIGMLETFNRQLIDPVAQRYFFVAEPVEIALNRTPLRTVKAPLLPGKRKYRKIPTSKKIFVDKLDYVANHGKEVRLMHYCNILLDKKAKVTSLANKDIPKIHWVGAKNVKIKVIMPDGRDLQGLAEPLAAKIAADTIVQFERIGFARCEKKGMFYFAHR